MKKFKRFFEENRQPILTVLYTALLFSIYAWGVAKGMRHPLRVAVAFILLLSAGAALIALCERLLIRKKGAVKDRAVLSRIIFETLDVFSSPLILCRANGKIFWCNEGMKVLMPDGRKPYGKTVFDVLGVTLDSIREAAPEDGLGVDFAGHYFIAKYNAVKYELGGAMVLLTESTELKTMGDELDLIHERLVDGEPVVAYIVVDNLTEMIQYDNESYRPAAAKIEELLRDWAAEAKGILKEVERDKYLFVFERKHLGVYIDRKFELLDRIRNVRVGPEQLSVTVSVGIAQVYGTFAEKDKAARAALEMALGRGGDQVVVKKDGATEFYGGRTKATRRRSSVRSRVVSNELLMHISRSSNVLIMGHRFPDYDSVASCVGLARLAMFCGVDVNIVTDTADENVAFCREYVKVQPEFADVFVTPDRGLDLIKPDTLVILSDVNNLGIVAEPQILCSTRRYAVIDHHRKQAEYTIEPLLEYIDPKASSASELVAEMLEQVLPQGLLTKGEANLLLAGIMLDTKQFTRMTGTRTYGAALYLHECGAEPQLVQELFKTDIDEYTKEASFRSNAEIYREHMAITVCDATGEDTSSAKITASKAAEGLIGVRGIKAAFAIVTVDDMMHISARSTGDVNVQLILEKLKGGGHFDIAGAQLQGHDTEKAVALIKSSIDEYLMQE